MIIVKNTIKEANIPAIGHRLITNLSIKDNRQFTLAEYVNERNVHTDVVNIIIISQSMPSYTM